MDTPERDQIDAPSSKFEESPFSNFVNSLSPIKSTKALNISQTLSSISFSSPPSVFTSPHMSLQKESKFLRRYQLSDLTKVEFTSTDERRVCETKDSTDTVQKLESSSTERVQCPGVSSCAGVASISGVSGDMIKLRRELKHGCASPNHRTDMPSCSDTRNEADMSSFLPFSEGGCLFAAELNCQEAKENNERTGHEWDSLISDAADLFVLDSSNGMAGLEGKSQQQLDADISFFASLFSPPQDGVNSQQYIYDFVPMSSKDLNESKGYCTGTAEPSGERKIHQEQHNVANNSMNDSLSSNPCQKSKNEPNYNCHRGTRRRCLVFEIPGCRKNMDGGLFSSSSGSLHEGKNGNTNKRMASLISASNTSQCLVPGIGLHLNALAAASNKCRIPNQETSCSEGSGTAPEKTNLECVINSSDSTYSEESKENKDHVVEEASHISAFIIGEDLKQNSPRKKRCKSENTGEVEGCKRCSCKKSKCLKLYCECFAAGVYCVEPCSCQGCFNKPIYEDTVIATRKQIESRNPLAFAPKVIRSSDTTPGLGDDLTRTPASARHKRGCNCKKSSCLKKYCECYQGGVGCSIGCRCEGCQNVFGRNDGSIMMGIEAETEGETPKCMKGSVVKSLVQPGPLSDEQSSESTIPRTPLQHVRPSLHPTSSKGKPPGSSFTGSTFSGLHPCNGSGRSAFLRCKHRTKKHNQVISGDDLPAVLQGTLSPNNEIKSLSPNSKRVSPPHQDTGKSLYGPKSTRKLILESIPAFPSLLSSSLLNG